MYCNEEVDRDWRTVECNLNLNYPDEGAACFDPNSDGNALCVRKCELGSQPARCERDELVSCREKKYNDGSVGGVLWWEYCPYGCTADTNGVAKCNEKPSEL